MLAYVDLDVCHHIVSLGQNEFRIDLLLKRVIIVSGDGGFVPIQCQAITWTNADLLYKSIEPHKHLV